MRAPDENLIRVSLLTSMLVACGPHFVDSDGDTAGESSGGATGVVSASGRGSDDVADTTVSSEGTTGESFSTGTESDSTTTGPPPDVLEHCGDGVLDPGEYCDDGNNVDYDECPWNCRERPETRLAVGQRHACVALGSVVRCWGDGADGRNGAGISGAACASGGAWECSAAPSCCLGDDELPSAGPSHVFGQPVVALDAGTNTCVLLEDGTIGCWGPGYHGVLGPVAFAACGGTTDCTSSPACCVGDDEPATQAAVVDFGVAVQQVSVADEHACVRLADGSVRCWGEGTYGRLGYGDEARRGDDEPIASLPAVDIGGAATDIATGALSTCATLVDGTMRCWGACANPTGVNTACLGQPGPPSNVSPIGDDEAPTAVPAIVLGFGASALAAGAGRYHGCLIATGSVVRCWGDDIDAAIGSVLGPATPDRQQTVDVAFDGVDAGQLSVGAGHACVVIHGRDGEQVECWGRSTFGATGYATTENIGESQPPFYYGHVQTPRAQSVSAGDELTCALTIDEEVYCWGAAAGPHGIDGAHGHPGAGNIGDDETPMSVGPVSVW